MKVSKWGNSLAIRIPADVAANQGIKEGDEVDAVLTLRNDAELAERRRRLDEMWERVDQIRDQLKIPADFKFDREEANSRGRE